jgi:VIT1/CCC1 family predicted Fe2+/Mn2+ transporter
MVETRERPASSADEIKRLKANFRDEVDGAALYRLLAAAEDDAALRSIYEQLAQHEERHRRMWESRLRAAGAEVPPAQPSTRVRFLGWLARRFGTGAVAPIVTNLEASATTAYDTQADAVAARLPAQERSHARIFREITRRGGGPAAVREISLIEGRHRLGTGNALRAAVLGVNDGLVSTLSLVMGVAGADPGRDVVVLSGMAGLLAGSISMALGEWISVRSSAESFERELAIERDELELYPEEEEAELALIYQAKGLSPASARETAARIMANRDTALDTLAREELGMAPEEVGNPWVAAATSFLLFAAGAILPVLPWFFVGAPLAVFLSAVVAGIGLFVAGAATSLFTGRSFFYSGARMLVFGLAAAAITFAIGRAIGVSTGI